MIETNYRLRILHLISAKKVEKTECARSGANLPDVADVQKGPRAQALPAQISDAVSMPDSSSGFQLINKHNFCDDQPA